MGAPMVSRTVQQIFLPTDVSFPLEGALQERLEKYITRWDGLVKLYRTGKRVGLIEARTLGAQKSTGDVIIVLDAHCECVSSFSNFNTNRSFRFRSSIGFHRYSRALP